MWKKTVFIQNISFESWLEFTSFESVTIEIILFDHYTGNAVETRRIMSKQRKNTDNCKINKSWSIQKKIWVMNEGIVWRTYNSFKVDFSIL